MWRIIFLGLIAYVIFTFVKRKIKSDKIQREQENSQAPANKNSPPNVEKMAQCAHCGLHIPTSEALIHNNKTYCCKKHIKAE